MAVRPPSYSNPDPHAVAIIGLSISAPGGEARGLDTEAFYEFLKSRGSGIITVPADRWNAEAYHGTGPGRICTTKGGFIPEFSTGDLQEFGITPAEATQVAVTQLVSLHQAFNALQRSGVDYRGTNTGVYVGCAGGGAPFEMDITQAGAYYMTGTSLSITANRINYVFDLLGPSLPVDTACSSSLTAMHLAMQAIRNGECDQAVVAGLNYVMTPLETSSFSQLGVLSPDGISKSFDDGANGYARGDVASAVVIKRHDLAVRDRDHIFAALVGSALTSCGSIMGSLTTPSPEAQAQAIRNAYQDAGLKPYQADYVELHGTGTVVGDSLEANAAGALFSEGRGGREIVIGSVKSNVGHGEMGAYMSSLVKVVMMLDKRQILPNGYFQKPSSKIDFEKYNLRVPVEVEDLVAHDFEQGIIVSISSFGFGGSCGHTVLREHERYPEHPDTETLKDGPFLFAIGALSPKSVRTLEQRYREQCAQRTPLALCTHLGNRARQMPWRSYAIADSLESATFPDPVLVGKRPNPLVLCFSGQGPQHWQQGRDLMTMYSVFRESIYACNRVHTAYTGNSFLEETGLFIADAPVSSPLAKSLTWPANVISVAITFFQIAMFDLLTSLGIKPNAMLGHSIGETAVLYASGAMPREMVVEIAIARGRALSMVDNTGGGMVAISGCDADAVRDYVDAASSLANLSKEEASKLYMAAFNSPTDIGVSGSELLVDLLTKYIETWVDGVVARKLRVSTAVHSPFVDPCEDVYRAELATIFSRYTGPFVPVISTMSTVTAEFKTDGYTIDYLWRNLRQPVLFSSVIPLLVNKFGENTTFVEISPHPVLSQYIKKMGAFDSLATATRPPSARHLKPGAKRPKENQTLLQAMGQLLLYGVNSINFSILNGCPSDSFEGPAYPFNMRFYPFAAREASYLRRLLPATRPLNSTRLRVCPQLPEPWMSHHVIDHSNLIPAAAYIEMALEFPGVTQVWDCRFEAACILEEGVPPVTLEVAKDGINWWVKSSSSLQTMQGDLEWTRATPEFDTVHAHGKLGYGVPDLSIGGFKRVDVAAVLARCTSTHQHEELYAELEGIAQFGSEFMRVQRAAINENEAICWIKGHADGLNKTDYVFHPALMDAVFQSAISWNMLYDKINVGGKERSFLLPHSLRRAYRVDGRTEPIVLPEEFRTYSVLLDWSAHHWTFDAYVLDEDDSVIIAFEGLHFTLVSQDDQWPTERYMMYWQPRALPTTEHEGMLVLDRAADDTDSVHILCLLDQLALKYTHETLSTLPEDTKLASSDRVRYLAWAKGQVQKAVLGAVPEIGPALRDKYASLLELTERVGKGQKEIMQASTAAVELLFRDDIMSKVYEHPPFVGCIFDKTVEQFIELVKEAVSAGKRVVRILEVGAGTGRFTALLGQAMVDAKLDQQCYVDYVSTDISISLAQESTAKSPWLTMTPMAFDLSVPIEQQNLDPASFDIVVAFDVLHAIPNIHETLVRLHELLLPGGHLAVIELDGNSFANGAVGTIWMDFIFGSFAEWMGVLDQRPGATHCSLSPAEWKSALQAAGFADTLLVTSSGRSVSHMAFITQGSLSPTSTSSSPLRTPSPGPTTPLNPDVVPNVVKVLSGSSPDLTDVLGRSSIDDMFSKQDVIEISTPAPPIEIVLGHDLTVVRRFTAGDEVSLVQFLSELDATKHYVIWLYTDMEESNLSLIGIARSIRHEFSLWKIMMALFHPSWDAVQQEDFVYGKLVPLKWIDAEVMVDESGNLHVPRVVSAPSPPHVEPREDKALAFDESRIWRVYPEPLGPDDVEVTVAFTSLSPAFPDCSEFSGKVSAVGSGVPVEMIGRRVFGVAASRQGNVIVCSRSQVTEVPDGMHASTAAAIAGRLFFVSSVVTKALAFCGVRSPRILLHAGVSSPAAVATYLYLKARGLDVFVTVTEPSTFPVSPSSSPAVPIFSTTPLDIWSFRVREWAKKGVDVTFNFDGDPSVAKETLSLLSRRGTLVQIGGELPHRIQRGHQLVLVDYPTLLDEEDIAESALESIQPPVRSLIAPSVHIFELSQLAVAQAKIRSQSTIDTAVLVDLQDLNPKLPILRGGIIKGTAAFDPRASYVVIGGVGGLGANIARCLVENGARHVILTSRSGENTFKAGRLIREKKIITYLRNIPGVVIDILAVDCLDVEKTKAVFANSSRRIAGVFYVAVRLNDQLFTNLTTEEDWKTVYDVKVKGLKVLLEAVNPSTLDFLVLTSSMATVSGSPGQANYAAAQTEMEEIGAHLPNTVSITVPPITDGGVFVRSMPPGNARNAALDKYKALGMSGMLVAEHCVDAIWTLNTSAANAVYIPSMNWKKVVEIGIPEYHLASLRHLLVKENADVSVANASNEQTIRAACAMVLSLNTEDVEENIPLSSYGLDSLTSVRLSGILKQYFDVTVTQLQLLSSYMTVEKLQAMQEEQRLASASEAQNAGASDAKFDATGQSNLENDMDKTIVRLNNVNEGRPFFILHGAGGGVLVLQKVAQKVNCPVYGVQDTPEAPITGTLDRLSRFYLSKIQEKQPHGPYRIGGFSFGTCLAVRIAQMLLDEGEETELLVLLDGTPTLFHRPNFQVYTKDRIAQGTLREDIMEVIADMSQSGSLDGANEITYQFSDHFSKVSSGGSGPKWVARFCRAYVAHVLMGVRASMDVNKREADGSLFTEVWPSKRTVLVRAEQGVSAQSYAEGASKLLDLEIWTSDVELHELPGTHFGILNPDSGLAEILNGIVA
ncbi:polyketide synthase [Laetiporus sulphureus 93-53]|uniref:Polyketide synthase n=1 Tax=Laetiporus sulphureus 93-53 TaxID=1314785 RepID=A0A165EF46_9APHY|nr:polyketide synthase [Laetiporus sulphureus 93-53]KZT06920.1 polyketide synthase [Laetiporus sulphureus 93-53]